MRRLFIGVACAATLVGVVPASAQAAFTSSRTANGAVLEGDAGSDTIAFKVAGGLVEHNRGGDPGFASARDFDTSAAGEQTVSDASRSRVVVNGNGGVDMLRVEEDGGGDLFWAFSPECVLRDPGRPRSGGLIYPGDGTNEVELCYGSGVESAEVAGGGGKDSFFFLDSKQDVPVSVDGRGGDDWLAYGGVSGPHAVRSVISYSGGAGYDEADMLDQRGTPGTYTLAPDAVRRAGYPDLRLAADVEFAWLYASDNADRITVTDSTRDVTVWAGAGDDVVDATATAGDRSRPTLLGEGGNDMLLGGGGSDVLFGGGGNDALDGGAGVDALIGGDDNDTLRARDGEGDAQLECGAGRDRLEADDLDRSRVKAGECEETEFRDGVPSGGGSADRTVPVLSSPKLSRRSFRVGSRTRTASLLTLRSSEAATLSMRFQLRTCKRRKCRYRTVPGTLTVPLLSGENAVAITGHVGGRKLRPGRYKLVLDVRDGARNKGKRRTLSLTVRR